LGLLILSVLWSKKFDGVAEPVAAYDADIDYEHEHRPDESGLSTSTKPRPKNYENNGMQRSGGGELSREIIATPAAR
jgi:hypothetical protein